MLWSLVKPDRPDMNDPCSKNDHLTDPNFTCCASKQVPPPAIYLNKNSKCWAKGSSGDFKIVKSAVICQNIDHHILCKDENAFWIIGWAVGDF